MTLSSATLLLCYIKQIDSMLPCVCSVIDHRRHQNVERTNKWHTSRQASVSLMFLSHFDVFCDLFLNRHMATWNRFVKWITHIINEILVDLVKKIIDFKKKQNGNRRILHMLTYSTTKRRNGWLSNDRCTNYLTFYIINVVFI